MAKVIHVDGFSSSLTIDRDPARALVQVEGIIGGRFEEVVLSDDLKKSDLTLLVRLDQAGLPVNRRATEFAGRLVRGEAILAHREEEIPVWLRLRGTVPDDEDARLTREIEEASAEKFQGGH